jgi:hypothetical protein
MVGSLLSLTEDLEGGDGATPTLGALRSAILAKYSGISIHIAGTRKV